MTCGIMENQDDDDLEYNATESTTPLINSDIISKPTTVNIPKVPGLISARYALAFFSLLGFLNVYAMRVNLSVALVAMVNQTETNQSSVVCPVANSTARPKPGEFDWDQQSQGQILASFFYGYIVTQLPGGLLADRYGAKKLFGLGVLCTAVFTLLTPLAARLGGIGWLIAVRVLEGLGEGVTFPAMHAMWGHWAPPLERSRLITLSYTGAHLGTVVSLPISGILCDSDLLGGWPSVFYVFGTMGVVWFLIWMLFVHDKPSLHPRISDIERKYIETSIGRKQKISLPLESILTSLPVWAIVIAHFCNNWGFYTLLTNLPTYLKNVLGFDISQSGFLAAVPYLMIWILALTGGQVADFLRTRGILSTSVTRKIFTTLGFILPAVFLVLTGYVGCDPILGVTFLTLSVAFSGLALSGYNVNHLDLAPDYAGFLMGITNMAATIPGFLGPLLVGMVTEHQETFERWRIVFWTAFGIYIFGMVAYLILGSGEKQPWAMDKSKELEPKYVDEDTQHRQTHVESLNKVD